MNNWQYLQDELDHLKFMVDISVLRQQIYVKWIEGLSIYQKILKEKQDIEYYGTEPVFSSMVHDALIEEANGTSRR